MESVRKRDDWTKVWLGVAAAVAGRSSCSRSQVGAVMVFNNYWTFTGYNGPSSGEVNCDKGGCPRGLKSFDELPSGSSFEERVGFCTAVHAEINALRKAMNLFRRNWSDMRRDAILYTTREPCEMCWKYILQAGLSREQVVWPA